MKTTLRIDDKLYRKAKAEVARQGVTLIQFLEEALRLRLQFHPERQVQLPTFDSGKVLDLDPVRLKQLTQSTQTEYDLRKRGG